MVEKDISDVKTSNDITNQATLLATDYLYIAANGADATLALSVLIAYIEAQAAFMADLSDDASPTLGGALDAAGNVISNIDSQTIDEGGATTTPPSGHVRMYAKADGLLYSKDDAGAEKQVSGDTQLSAVRVYTSNDTWSKPSNIYAVVVRVIGGGGGGGGAAGGGSAACGAGGGGGGYSEARVAAASLGSTETVTVGSGGSGGAAGSAGSIGGNSSFGSHAQGGGGNGGAGMANGSGAEVERGGGGGAGSLGDINMRGAPGVEGIRLSAAKLAGGNGGAAANGGGGGLGEESDNVGNAGGNYGGGGGGASAFSTGRAGGDGAGGAVIVYEFTEN